MTFPFGRLNSALSTFSQDFLAFPDSTTGHDSKDGVLSGAGMFWTFDASDDLTSLDGNVVM